MIADEDSEGVDGAADVAGSISFDVSARPCGRGVEQSPTRLPRVILAAAS